MRNKILTVPTDPTRPAVLAEIRRCEAAGEFDHHTDPVDNSLSLPVTPDFPYIPHGFLQRARTFFRRQLVVYPFTRKINSQKGLGSVIHGKENLRGIGAAVLTCNHVNKFDCLLVQYACRPNRPFVVAAPFNNMKGRFGDMMRAGGMLPLGRDLSTMKSFLSSVNKLLARGRRILIYPEQAMWWNYEKPRPYHDGAFDIAAKNGVPIVPLFITFRPSGLFDGNGIEKKYLTLHIMPPIYPDKSKNYRENVRALREENMRLCREKYREVYGSYPTYGDGTPEGLGEC